MKKSRLLVLITIALVTLGVRAADSDSRDDEDRWRRQNATNDLLDKQKLLLEKENRLAGRAQHLKQEINQLTTELSNTQTDLDDVRHELIVLRVKLL